MAKLKIKRDTDYNGEVFYSVHKDPKRKWTDATINWNNRWKQWYFNTWECQGMSSEHMIQVANFMAKLKPLEDIT
jgi:hypothetical protein